MHWKNVEKWEYRRGIKNNNNSYRMNIRNQFMEIYRNYKKSKFTLIIYRIYSTAQYFHGNALHMNANATFCSRLCLVGDISN